VPEAAVEFEMEEREKTFRQQLEQINASVEQFCKIKGVTMEELKQQWHKDSHDALENDVFLSKYAEKRDIEVTEDELEEEIDRIKKRSEAQAQAAQAQAQAQKGGAKAQPQQPGGNQEMYDNPQWQAYIRRVLLKRKSYQGLLKEVEESK
jgi:FKBP-type peptidyl-prolyl cis-trans isomerase (trigger factor)